jgi:hypothetical protein
VKLVRLGGQGVEPLDSIGMGIIGVHHALGRLVVPGSEPGIHRTRRLGPAESRGGRGGTHLAGLAAPNFSALGGLLIPGGNLVANRAVIDGEEVTLPLVRRSMGRPGAAVWLRPRDRAKCAI